jgi:GT2 family glycosyltransferase
VESIRETSNVELILVDNDSKFWSDYLTSEADKLIKFDTNRGYVKAINSGFEIATGDYLVAGNNDFRLSTGWEEEMKYVVDNVGNCAISCLHVVGNEKSNEYRTEHCSPGGWWMVKKETLDKVGLLDEQFFNTFGDLDLCWRLKEMGLLTILSPKVSIEHIGEASLSKFNNREKEYNESCGKFHSKWSNNERHDEFVSEMRKEQITQCV